MSNLLILLSCCALSADADKPTTVRYLRPAEGKWVLESAITITPTRDGTTYVSLTDRGAEKMTLTLRFNKDNQVTAADLVHETAQGKKTAALTLEGTKGQLKRDAGTDALDVAANPIVTTAPDWSDIFQLVRRYDAKKGGKQEFAGLWIHPTRPTQMLTFTAERLGGDTIKVKGDEVKLDRYRIRLRSGDYLVWADATGRVLRLTPPGAKATPVVLEGYEDSTKDLK